MKFDIMVTFKKAILGFVTGLAAVVIFGIVQALTNYKPVVCTNEIVENCTPQYLSTLYYAIIPVITSTLVGLGNWLKNRGNA